MSGEVNESRKIETLENLDLDFNDDVTELETFGVTTTKPFQSPRPESTSMVPSSADSVTVPVKAPAAVVPGAPDGSHSRSLSQILLEQLQKEKQLVTGVDSGPEESKVKDGPEFSSCGENSANFDKSLMQICDLKAPAPLQVESAMEVETSNRNDRVCAHERLSIPEPEHADSSKEITLTSDASKPEGGICNSDTDEDCLIIDTECKNNSNGKAANADSNLNSNPVNPNSSTAQPSTGNQTNSTCPDESCVLKKPIKRVYKKFDPVGEILKMQDELLKPISKNVPELPFMNLENSQQPPASEQPFTPSDTSSWPRSSWPSAFQKPKGRE